MAFQTDRSNVVPVSPKVGAESNQIGALLVDAGKLIPQDAERVLRYAKEKGVRFGDAAIELGLVTREEIDRVVALQFDYPYLVPGESPVAATVVAAYSPFSRQVESLRALRSQLLLRWFGDELVQRRLAIVSPDRRDGRSYLAANLAVVFSQLGERTLLVDADMRHPKQHDLFALDNTVGLSTVLSARAGTEAVQRIPAFVALSVLPAGPQPPNPQELLNRASFSRMLDEWASEFDVVLLDTSAATDSADCTGVASRAGGALILTRLNKTKLDAVKMLSEHLVASNASVVGAVVNG
jgi:receptor protein-tyrosine kinase